MMQNPYDKYILPKVVDLACSGSTNERQRQKIVPLASGDVLEVAVGSGLNIPFYEARKITSLTAIDPSDEIWRLRRFDEKKLDFPFKFVKAPAEVLPFKNGSFDTVLITYALCTIRDTEKALSEITRVLKPGGRLLFCEHGLAPDNRIRFWQQSINPVWKRIGGGCNLNRDIPLLLAQNHFRIVWMEKMYIPGWKPASYNYWGEAVPELESFKKITE